jgi:hypothetical protein
MLIRRIKSAFVVGFLSMVPVLAFAAGPAATIDQLAWMTGTYAGQLGSNQLEENWIKPEGSSIAALVRMTGNDATSMFEMITIEEVDGSLVLNIQQWNPGFEPRTPTPQTMVLSDIGPNRVQFTATSEGGMRSLGYSKSGDTFTIHVGQANGGTADIPLTARTLWD